MAKRGTVDDINAKITAIFKKHRVRVGPGEEEFWLGVERVEKKSKADAKKLERLADNWQVAMSFMHERSKRRR